MSQIFQVLKCSDCSMFQVQFVTKAKKWICHTCGTRQSTIRNYGTGTARECRLHVQKLNKSYIESSEMYVEPVEQKVCSVSKYGEIKSNTGNKWLKYVDDEDLSTQENPLKRKINPEESEEESIQKRSLILSDEKLRTESETASFSRCNSNPSNHSKYGGITSVINDRVLFNKNDYNDDELDDMLNF